MSKPQKPLDLSKLPLDLSVYGAVLVTAVVTSINGSQRLIMAESGDPFPALDDLVTFVIGMALAAFAAWRLGRIVGAVLLTILAVLGKAAGLSPEPCGDPDCTACRESGASTDA